MNTNTVATEKTVISQTSNGGIRVKSPALANVMSATSQGAPTKGHTNRPAPLMVPGV